MKKLLLIACILFAGTSIYAEKGPRFGANVLVSTETGSNFGIGVRGQYGLTENIRGEGSFSLISNSYHNITDLSFNAHYLIPVEENIVAYPLAGFSLTNAFETDLGINLGGGVDYLLDERITLDAQLRYRLSGLDALVAAIGLTYRF